LYTGGRLEVRLKSAAVMPGIVTAMYLASGDGRTGGEEEVVVVVGVGVGGGGGVVMVVVEA